MKRNVWYIPGHSGSIPAPYGTVYRYFSVFYKIKLHLYTTQLRQIFNSLTASD